MENNNLNEEKDKEKTPDDLKNEENKKNEEKDLKEEEKKNNEKKNNEKKENIEENEDFDEEKFTIDEDKEDNGKFSFKTILLLVFVVTLIIATTTMYNKSGTTITKEVSYTEFLKSMESGEIVSVEEKGGILTGKSRSNKEKIYKTKIVSSALLSDSSFMKAVNDKKIELKSVDIEKTPLLVMILIQWFPMFLLIGIGIYMLKQMNKGSGGGPTQIFNMGKSKTKDGENKTKIKFDDVAGVVEAKVELKEVVDFLKEPEKFTKIGAKIPKGVLLLGEPGTGKTLLAKAVAGEAGVPFFSISGSEFVEMFVGVGASRVRDLFNKARKSSPCIVFIDEIDAVGRKRGSGHGGGNDEREQTLNQLLVEMDGFGTDEVIIVIAATNRPDVLDKALLRPGRFDRQVVVDAPDIKGREEILQVHARGKKFAEDVNFNVIAKRTVGFVGADLANLLNEAAILAARNNREIINMSDLDEAVEKVEMGPERKSRVMPEKERINTAYHEAGHALISYLIKDENPVHKITIIPRGRALGVTMYLKSEDKLSYSKNELKKMIKGLLGGRAAEDIIYGDVSTGASSDIERATHIAYNMVTVYGMSDEIGPMRLGTIEDGSLVATKNYGDEIAKKVDNEIHKIINTSYEEVVTLLKENREQLEAITKVLLEKETISGEEMIEIIKGMEKQAEV